MKYVQPMLLSKTLVKRYDNPESGCESYMPAAHGELPNSIPLTVPKPLEKLKPPAPSTTQLLLLVNSFPISLQNSFLALIRFNEPPPRWEMTRGFSGTRSFVILIKHPTCLKDPLRTVLSVDTRSMVIIVKDVLFSDRNLRKIFLHMALNMEFFKILPSHPMTIPTLLMLFESHSLSIKTSEEEKKIEEEQEANARYCKIPACYDDDDDYAFAITPNVPVNSLSMRGEHLDTISAMESDEFIKSNVENLVPIPSESKGKLECDMPVCEEFTTFSNILFDSDYDFYSSDDQSFSDEDLSKEIYSNPLFEEEIIPMKKDQHHYNAESDLIESLRTHDSSVIISLKIDSLFDEFAGELTLLKSIPLRIDETDCYREEETHFIKRLLYDNSSSRPPEEFVSANSDTEIKSFSPSFIPIEDSDSLMEEIDSSFTPDYPMPLSIEEDNYDSERDVLILEKLLSNDTLSLPEIESFMIFFHSLVLMQNHQMVIQEF
nr:hypothetical protein [Tanacetum cinerariifolium]